MTGHKYGPHSSGGGGGGLAMKAHEILQAAEDTYQSLKTPFDDCAHLLDADADRGLIAAAITTAIAAERERCLRAVALAQPETSGVSGMVLQQRTGHDWIVSVKRVIAKAIAEPQEDASREEQPSEPR